MDTAERTETPAEQVYDGFISYSHAADGLLAPRLQAGLQRFAKPWWKRRALRIFRDESSLSANPHLWSSITDALDTSGWFVLLLSPDAAQSEWVNQEVAYWVEHKDPDRIIPVLTDGEFAWDGDVTGSAVPNALRGSLSEEPRWVDARELGDPETLDLKNPEFAAVVADLAAPLRGVPKDELASEEVRQHKRTVRTAWAAGAVVLVLAVAAGWFGVLSARNAGEAERQAEKALANEREAEANAAAEADARAEADASAERADAEADAARAAETLARSRELAASAIGVLEADPELATLLALESIDLAPVGKGLFPEGLISLREATDRNRLLGRLTLDDAGLAFADWDASGEALVVSTESDATVRRHDVVDGRVATTPSWEYSAPVEGDVRIHAIPHPSLPVAVVVTRALDWQSGGLTLIDLDTGREIRSIELPPCEVPWEFGSRFTGGGSLFAASSRSTDCAVDPLGSGSIVLDTMSWDEVARFEGADVTVTDDGTRVLIDELGSDTVEIRSFPDQELIVEHQTGPTFWRMLSPDGRTIVVRYPTDVDLRPGFYDAETGDLIDKGDSFEGFMSGGAFFASDDAVLVPSTEADVLYELRTGVPILRLPTAATVSASISPDGSRVATTSFGGVIEVWRLSDDGSGTILSDLPDPVVWFNPDIILDGPRTAALGFPDFAVPWDGVGGQWLLLLEPESGAMIEQRAVLSATQLPDGRFAYVPLEPVDNGMVGSLSLWDPDSGELAPLQDCAVEFDVYYPADNWDPLGFVCPDGDLLFGGPVAAAWDGRYLAQIGWDPATAPEDLRQARRDAVLRIWDVAERTALRSFPLEFDQAVGRVGPFGDGWVLIEDGSTGTGDPVVLAVYDTESGERIAELQEGGIWRETREMNHDYSRLYAVEEGGRVYEYDTKTWTALRSWQAMEGRPRGMALSPDGGLLAVSGEDELIAIWSIGGGEPQLVDRIPIGAWPSDITWIDDDLMGVAIKHDGLRTEWRVVDLDPEAVVRAARAATVRDFTPDECQTYNIERCLVP